MSSVRRRATWQSELDQLLVREKAHTREGDAIAAARRRLPMTLVDADIRLIGEHGDVPLIDIFEGRRQLLVYFHMWHDDKPAAEQCEGCTFFTGHATELSYLHSRDVTYATICQGPYDQSARYRDFMGWTMPWYSARDRAAEKLLAGRHFGAYANYLRADDGVYETYWSDGRGTEAGGTSYHLLDLTVYGRQETWEDSPDGWPQIYTPDGDEFRLDGRPTAQWPRLHAGHSDDLGD